MSKFIHRSHNVTVLMYHLVCPAKYRRVVFSEQVEKELKEVCIEISERYEIDFLEIGIDKDHVHFFVQSIPMYSPTEIARKIKSITAREIFKRVPEVKKLLWGGKFWTEGYYMSTVGRHGDEDKIGEYVRNQGVDKSYKILHSQAAKKGQTSIW